MATGSARRNRHGCGAIKVKTVVVVCKAPQDVSSDTPNETGLRRQAEPSSNSAEHVGFIEHAYNQGRIANLQLCREGATASGVL